MVVQLELAVVESPAQRRQGAALVEPGLPSERSGRLARRRRAEDLVAGSAVGIGDAAQGGGLARAGDAEHEADPFAASADGPDGLPLVLGERMVESGLRGGYRARHDPLVDDAAVMCRRAAGDGLGDGLLRGDDRRERPGPAPGTGDGQQRDGLG